MTRTKPTVTAGPSEAVSSFPFSQSLPVGINDETETANAHPSKGKGPDITPFAASQPRQNPIAALNYDLSKLEEEQNSALTAVVAENEKTLGQLESRLTELHSKADKRLDTDLFVLSDDLISINRPVLKVEDDLT